MRPDSLRKTLGTDEGLLDIHLAFIGFDSSFDLFALHT